MGASSFRLGKVGGGYWSVLIGLWLRYVFRMDPYRALSRHDPVEEIAPKEIAPGSTSV